MAELQFKSCSELPSELLPWCEPQCVLLHDNLYIGDRLGGTSVLYKCSAAELGSWVEISTPPTKSYGLSTYHSLLVLVGGEYSDGTCTDEVWLSEDPWYVLGPEASSIATRPGLLRCLEHWHSGVSNCNGRPL